MELYCTTCDECIIGYYESNSENCIPDVEEHTTHEWRKIENKCTECVYIAKNITGLKSHMKKKYRIQPSY